MTTALSREERRQAYRKSSGGFNSLLQEVVLKLGAALLAFGVIMGTIFFVSKPLIIDPQTDENRLILRQEVTDVVNFIESGVEERDLTVLQAVEESVLVQSPDMQVGTLDNGTEWFVYKEGMVLNSRAFKESYSYGYNSLTDEYMEGSYEEVRSAGN